VLNLLEVGASEWDDYKTKRVAVPAWLHGERIHHGVNRNLKHVTIVPCVAASREHPVPHFLSSQDSKFFQVDLQKHEIELGKRLTMQ
jgi:hypothetical protein